MNIIRPTGLCLLVVGLIGSFASHAPGQTTVITPSVRDSVSQVAPTRVATLEDYLISKLRATTDDQRDYVREIVKLVDERKLERRLVIALQRYSTRKSPHFPLPIFERAMRVEAGKRGVAVPTIKEIVARNGVTAAQAVRDTRILR